MDSRHFFVTDVKWNLFGHSAYVIPVKMYHGSTSIIPISHAVILVFMLLLIVERIINHKSRSVRLNDEDHIPIMRFFDESNPFRQPPDLAWLRGRSADHHEPEDFQLLRPLQEGRVVGHHLGEGRAGEVLHQLRSPRMGSQSGRGNRGC